jgi:hypothetical protein
VARARCDVSSLKICADAGHSSAIGSFQAVAAFIVALTSTDSDGRVIVTSAKPGDQPHEGTLKFVMLNAAKHFQPVSSLYSLFFVLPFACGLLCLSAFLSLSLRRNRQRGREGSERWQIRGSRKRTYMFRIIRSSVSRLGNNDEAIQAVSLQAVLSIKF